MRPARRTPHTILGFLTWGPMSGYDIKRAVENSISNFWSESFGQIYPALRRLEQEGLAELIAEPSTAHGKKGAGPGGRERKLYRITEKGHRELRRWLAEPIDRRPHRNELLLKTFFGKSADRATLVRHLEDFRDELRSDLERYRSIRAELEPIAGDANHTFATGAHFSLLTLRYGELEHEALLRWAGEALASIANFPAAMSERSPTKTKTPRASRGGTK